MESSQEKTNFIMNRLIIANWKLNPKTAKDAEKLALAEDYEGVIIAPSFPHLKIIGDVLRNASLAAQDIFWESGGAYTGEVSPSQLKDIGITHAIIGHSERRNILGETDEMINKKVKAALDHGIEIILCVGEHIDTRKQGIDVAKTFVAGQLDLDLRGVQGRYRKKVVIAYEPVWAIGTGISDIPEETAEICAYIKNLTGATQIIYGGSVNSQNAEEFFSQDDIEGALVGGASLKPKEFQKIVEAA